MNPLTKEQALLVSAYTGFLCVNDFSEVHEFAEKAMERPVFTHEFADPEFYKDLRSVLRAEFLQLVP